MLPELLEAWRTNDRINFFLVDRISAEGMKCTLSKAAKLEKFASDEEPSTKAGRIDPSNWSS